MKKLFAVFFSFFFCLNHLAHADDTAFGGSGSLPMPIEQNGIKMIDDQVRIIGKQIDKENIQGEWQVSCDFTFQNTTNKTIELSVGFPFPVYEEGTNVSTPAGKVLKQGDPLVYDFKVTIDGKSVQALKQKIASNQEKGLHYTDAYIWKMNFLPNQTVKVHHDYTIGVTLNVLGQSYVTYVLRTGGLWKDGTIGSAKLEIIPNIPTRLCSELKTNPEDYLKPKPADVQIVGTNAERKYVWNFKDYKPNEDLDVCLQTGKNYVRYAIIYPLLHDLGEKQIDLATMNKEELRILRNTISAQYGRQFESADLQDYFNKQWWYQPNKNYSEQMLTKEDRQALALIQKAEAQKQ